MKAAVVVEQCENPRYNPHVYQDNKENPRYLYRVVKTTNTLRVNIGMYINPYSVDEMIKDGIEVVVNQESKKKRR